MSEALRKAAEQAINALIEARSSMYDGTQQDKAINALRAALAAPPAQTPCQYAVDVAMTEHRCVKECQYAKQTHEGIKQ